MPITRPIAILGVTTLFLLLALACGSGDAPDPDPATDPSSTPSLGDLLGAEPATATDLPADQEATTHPPLAEFEIATPEVEPEPVETPECTHARAALRTQREAVDARRAREIASAEHALASGQLAMQNCLKTHPCNEDAKLMAVAQEKEESGEAGYQAAMQRVAQFEAGLFEYEQAVDHACGRR